MIGAGGQQGQGDAANLLKPALARGELRTIAATTWAEYKKYFEDDAALKRRFQVVKVGEPDHDKAVRMMRGLTAMLEKHHRVRILDEAVEDAVRLSARYITDRQLPDKSVSLLDTALRPGGAEPDGDAAGGGGLQARHSTADVEIGILQREQAVGAGHAKRLEELRQHKKNAEARLATLEKQWQEEKKLVEAVPRAADEAGSACRGGRQGGQGSRADVRDGGRTLPRRTWRRSRASWRSCKAKRRWCSRWWAARRWPRWCRRGPACRSARWWSTRSARCWG